ncbi:hypothetical protein PR002_g7861 [Phytophthora rubi]|uniref:Uncharacterized protein n=1 Tax=Phytophthora rubi TaxID=129364 RepID=A0A6A3N1P0_9STRA|nr:hypothetical protein PR002_g7861 [Phytophthora rubi]
MRSTTPGPRAELRWLNNLENRLRHGHPHVSIRISRSPWCLSFGCTPGRLVLTAVGSLFALPRLESRLLHQATSSYSF